ncbi:endonuclease domain-containing protein [Nocardiopsis terrae]|uniref:endonuclease domain-containing protein n=1 Tax=Streptomyces sp. NPDC057554 TaxID=3350538 RepID=UPI0036ABA201
MDDPTMRIHRDPDPNAEPHTLEALTQARQNNLLWHLATDLNREQVEALMPAWTVRPCATHYVETTHTTAIEGDDGRFHLWAGTGMICGHRRKRAKPTEPWQHDQMVSAWTDGTRYRSQPFAGAERGMGPHRHTWLVQPTGEPVPADTVPPKRRCPAGHGREWPTWINRPGARGEARRRLIRAFGRKCAICGKHGQFMDHDAFTGLVRGLLCRYCNTHVDSCPHTSGCEFAEYLNDPPAVGLDLVYPDLGKTYARTLARAEAHGWEPMLFAEVRKRRSPKSWRGETLPMW